LFIGALRCTVLCMSFRLCLVHDLIINNNRVRLSVRLELGLSSGVVVYLYSPESSTSSAEGAKLTRSVVLRLASGGIFSRARNNLE
jgi:hypothetical protein